MISYCIAAFRPTYARLLIDDLICKTTVPYEILVWLNIDDSGFEEFLQARLEQGLPVRIIGKTPQNIGMRAYCRLFAQAENELIVQIDDDVVMVSRHIAEHAAAVFRQFPRVKQLVADVWQDEYTTGARPPMSLYRPYHEGQGLYDGPIDGWFSVFHRSVLPLVADDPGSIYVPLGGLLKNRLSANNQLGLLCRKLKVFHVIGPQYASHFGMLNFEIHKYRVLQRFEIVAWYEEAKNTLPPMAELHKRVEKIRRHLMEWSYECEPVNRRPL